MGRSTDLLSDHEQNVIPSVELRFFNLWARNVTTDNAIVECHISFGFDSYGCLFFFF